MKEFNLETQQWEGDDEPSTPVTSLGLLKSVYRDENQPLHTRMRAAIEALPYETPKLLPSVISMATLPIAFRQSILRSREPMKLIEAKPVPQLPPQPVKSFAKLRRW